MLEGKDSLLAYADKKGLSISRSKQLGDFVLKAQAERIKSLIDIRAQVVISMALFTFLVTLDLILGKGTSGTFTTLKAVLSLAVIGILGTILIKSSAKSTSPLGESLVREGFNVKAVTRVMATPDEISNALTDPVLRPQWDSSISAISKQSPESIQITYKGIDGLSTHTENIKVDFFMDKVSVAGSHFIQEYVNGEFYRLYELQTVQNRPQQLRVTLYTKVTPAAFNVREKDIFRSLNSMRNFIS